MSMYDLVIIGAGPSGLACAIEAKSRGLSHLVLEKGSVADAIRRFPVSMTFFSTAELLEIGNVPFMASGFRPTRSECVRYYQLVAKHLGLNVKLQSPVTGLRPVSGGFEVETERASYHASSVVVATGYFDDPNRFDVPGYDLPKVFRYYTEPFAFADQDVAVVGGKNSAVEIALDLFRNGARVTLIHRGSALSSGIKYWVLPDIENRIKAGEIRAFFSTEVRGITPEAVLLSGKHEGKLPNDALFVMIGYTPDTAMLESAGVHIVPDSRAPVHDPRTMETNVKGLFVAGSLAAGKFNNKIFIENGRGHGKLILDAITKAH